LDQPRIPIRRLDHHDDDHATVHGKTVHRYVLGILVPPVEFRRHVAIIGCNVGATRSLACDD
jgi:hypothetical protein